VQVPALVVHNEGPVRGDLDALVGMHVVEVVVDGDADVRTGGGLELAGRDVRVRLWFVSIARDEQEQKQR
jgi:hypothetical protein